MIDRQRKLEALCNFGMIVGQNPWFAFLIGFLVGQVDRVHFVRDLTDAEIAIRISAARTTVWPSDPLKATVRGIAMPNIYALVRAIVNEHAPICVSLDFDRADDTDWYQTVLLPSVSFVKDAEEAASHQSEMLWQQMDRTLDIYRECRALLQNDTERRQELEYYMKIAEQQMKNLSQQMEELNRQMTRISESQ
jgi:hypothetical protein